jgi:RNA polymerase sigma-70 factor (ECF subfamily)
MNPTSTRATVAAPDLGPPDAVLIARVRLSGDSSAFAALLRRHQSPVRALLRRLTVGDEALADDLAQETFIQAFRKLDQFRSDAKFSTWLYRIAYNAFLMQLRSRRLEYSLDAVDEFAAEGEEASTDVAAGSPSFEHTADLRMDLAGAMAGLSPAERAALVQCYYLDLSHDEAAKVLNCPVGTVKTHILRAKHKLRNALQAWAPGFAGNTP